MDVPSPDRADADPAGGTPPERDDPGAFLGGSHDHVGESAGVADEDRVEARLWEEAESSSSATSRVQALRELRAIYASRPKPEAAVPSGSRGISLAAVLELAQSLGIHGQSQADNWIADD